MRVVTRLVATGVLLLAPASAHAKPAPVPLASCVDRAPGAAPVATFATELAGRHSVRVPRGSANRIRGGGILGEHRTVFRPGHHTALRVRFHDGAQRIAWLLAGRTAFAGAHTPDCRQQQAPTNAEPGANPNTSPQLPGKLAITAQPDLQPRFSTAITDYVTRCDGIRPVMVAVESPGNTPVSVDGRPAQVGSFQVPVTLTTGQEFNFSAGGATYFVRCVPSDFPAFGAQRTGPTQAEFHFLGYDHYAVVVDDDGEPIWWYRSDALPADLKLLPDGNVAFGRSFGGAFQTDPDAHYEVRGLDGHLVRTVSVVGPASTDAHDMQVLRDGNYLVESYVPRDHVDLSAYGRESDATVYDAEIQEVTPGGQLVWTWNSKDHLSFAETSPRFLGPTGPYDYVHLNALQESADGNILFSARHTDAIYKIDRATGDVIWKLGGTTTPESLAVIGDRNDSQLLGGQHDIRELADSTITVFDDRTGLDGPPRGARFSIDDTAKTATLVEQVRDPEVPTSPFAGSARRMAGGDWVFQWGDNPLVTEVTPYGHPVFRLAPDGNRFSYRDNAVGFGVLSRAALRAGMDAQFPRG